MTKTFVLLSVLAVGCTSPEPPPSCQQAMSHYYGSGCTFFNINNNPPTPLSQSASQSACQDINLQVPDRCQREFETWLFCLDSTPANATTNSDCDCSQEQDALFACD